MQTGPVPSLQIIYAIGDLQETARKQMQENLIVLPSVMRVQVLTQAIGRIVGRADLPPPTGMLYGHFSARTDTRCRPVINTRPQRREATALSGGEGPRPPNNLQSWQAKEESTACGSTEEVQA